MRIFAIIVSFICAALTPFVLFPKHTTDWFSPEQLLAFILFWPVAFCSFFSLCYSATHFYRWKSSPEYILIFILASVFPGTMGATAVKGKIQLAEQGRKEKWFKYGKALNPLIIEYIQKNPEKISFPFNDDRAKIDGLGDFLKTHTDIPIKGNDIIDPWGTSVWVVVDHDHNLDLRAEDQSYGVYNSKGNKITLSLVASVPHSLDRTYNERWQIDDGVIPNK